MNNISVKKSINKAFMKISPGEGEFNRFKQILTDLYKSLCQTEENNESEEHQKNLISDFLKKSFVAYSVNTSGRVDLTISEKGNKKSNRLLFEVKRSSNKAEMITPEKINCKAMQELLYYYLQERTENIYLNHLIITNGFEWFIFDAKVFENLFYSNKKLISDFTDFSNKNLSGDTTDFFYREIASPAIKGVKDNLFSTALSLDNYFKGRSSTNPQLKEGETAFRDLVALYKLFTPTHLLKLPFSNDSNSLDKGFYSELLHIMGLVEETISGKKLIHRLPLENREPGSLLENTIEKIEDKDYYIDHPQKESFGENREERIFAMALGLVITWINRILFMKLLEGQLKSCRQDGDKISFLNFKELQNYDHIASLFFAILGKPIKERRERFRPEFDTTPYLNSSLFEQSRLERELFDISGLEDGIQIELYKSTVLKDKQGKKVAGKLPGLEYLLKFLDSYNFGSDSSTTLQAKQKTLINASVLGLVFEKINGYKDGSYYTPSFITMYLCRKTLRKRVIGKFSETHKKDYNSLEDIFNQIGFDSESLIDANNIMNSLKICDPSVGSGHFLVTALNELIVIKSELGILCDYNGKRLKGYTIEAVNDELIVSDEEGDLFFYETHKRESLRIQRTLFEEKRRIIESSLFGVDINNNSVKICRLRLWIELLKSTYYKDEALLELEILPNIDINIKRGNSLVSKYDLDESIKKPLKANGWDISHYQNMIYLYQNATDKEAKHSALEMIETLKNVVKVDMAQSNRITRDLFSFKGSLTKLTKQDELFEISKTEQKKREKEEKRLNIRIKNLEKRFKEIEEGHLYQDSFEWRFEFPEVLDSEGNFIGFDAIIGNPPYIQLQSMNGALEPLKDKFNTYEKTGDIYSLFYELGTMLLRPHGVLGYITSNKWMRAKYGKSLRNLFCEKFIINELIDFGDNQNFENATTYTNLFLGQLVNNKKDAEVLKTYDLSNCFDPKLSMDDNIKLYNGVPRFNQEKFVIEEYHLTRIIDKMNNIGTPLKEWNIDIFRGVLTGYNEAFIISKKKRDELISSDPKSAEVIKPILRGRDIRLYDSDFSELYLIATFPTLNLQIEDYPAIKNYLKSFGNRINQSGERGSRKKTKNKWFETQDQIAYWQTFEKEKIIYPNMTKYLPFMYDKNKFYTNQKCFIITGSHLKYLTGFLNSSLFKTYAKSAFPMLMGETYELSKVYFELIPIPDPTIEQENEIIQLVDKILVAKLEEKDTSVLEKEIDQIVYTLYGLTDDEIRFIKGI